MKINKRDESKTREQQTKAERQTTPIIRVRSQLRAGLVADTPRLIEPCCP